MGKSSGGGGDAAAAANVEGQFGIDAARNATYADRVNQSNPLGQNTWSNYETIDPSTGEKVTAWRNDTSLDSGLQSTLDSEISTDLGLSQQAAGMSGAVGDAMGQPLDFDQFGEGQSGPEAWSMDGDTGNRAEDFAYQRSANRLDPQFAKKKADMERTMAGRGLRAGDSAYDSAMSNFDRGSNDAYEQARLGAVGEGMQAHEQQFNQGQKATDSANALRSSNIEEYLGKRNLPLQEQNALRKSMNTGDLINSFGDSG